MLLDESADTARATFATANYLGVVRQTVNSKSDFQAGTQYDRHTRALALATPLIAALIHIVTNNMPRGSSMPTYPGFHPDFEIAGYPGQIRTAIRRIALHFYVTRPFHPTMIGNSKYWAVLVRPSDEFSVYINTDREVLIVFSEYTTFEIRTLDAYDAFYEHLDYSRVDKSLRFLVSADDRIESIIRHYLDQNPEYPIIIPTTFNSFDNSANTLLDAVRRNYLLRDLFGYQNPLREENFFFGRQHIVTSVLDMARSGQNSSLFGLRKSGKTSAIYAVQRKSRALSCNVTVVDCQNPAVHARTYDGLLTHILSEIRRSSGLKRVVIDLGSTLSSVSENFVAQMTIS